MGDIYKKWYLWKYRVDIVLAFCIACFLLYMHKDIALVEGSDDMIFFVKAQSMSYGEWISNRYMTWSGRLSADSLIYFLVQINLNIWKVLNACMLVLFAYAANRIFMRRISIYDILFVLLTFGFIGHRILTSAVFNFHGSLNYLWPVATGLFSLIPLADRLFYSRKSVNTFTVNFAYGLSIVFTIFANEQIGLVVCVFYALYLIFSVFDKVSTSRFVLVLFVLSVCSLLAVLFSPGNSLRYSAEVLRWYPDFHTLSVMDHIKRDTVWFFKKMFVWQSYLLIILGIAASYFYTKIYSKRNYILEVMVVMPLAFVLMRGLGNFDDVLTRFRDRSDLLEWIPYIFWIMYAGFLMYVLFRIDKRKVVNLLIFYAGVVSLVIVALSPSIFASGNRVAFVCAALLIVLINKLRVESGFDTRKILVIYSVFSITHLLILSDKWSGGFTIFY